MSLELLVYEALYYYYADVVVLGIRGIRDTGQRY
jgi:hypothetical protein